MVRTNMLQNVLKLAAKVSEPPEQQSNPQESAPVVQRWRYYFYDARPENNINFTNLTEILNSNSPEKDALIQKLQGGNTGKYFADYFRWIKIVVATNEYTPGGKNLIVYEADLTPIGSKVPGSEKIFPEGAPVTTDRLEADLLLFSDKRGNSDVLNIDNSGESFFSEQEPPTNIEKILINRARPAGRFLRHNDFIKKFDEYRIWVPNLNQLLLPNFETPKTDGVSGGHYVGGRKAFDSLVGPIEQKQEEKGVPDKSLKEKIDKDSEPGKDIFEPVQKENVPVKGDVLDNPAVRKFSSDLHRLRRMARVVVSEYIADNKDAALEVGQNVKKQLTPDSIDPKAFIDQAKKFDEMEKEYKNIARRMEQISKKDAA